MTYIFAHRGASKYAPENTMSSFKKALEMKADGIELDVQLTKDKVPVIIHDETVKRTTDGKGFVSEFTYKQLQNLDSGKWFSKQFTGERIPSLEEFLIWMKQTKLLLNIELKNTIMPYYGMEKIVYDLVDQHKLRNRVIYSSFNHYSLQELKKMDPNVEIAPLYSSGLYQPWNYVKSLSTDCVHPHWRTLHPTILKGFRDCSIKVRTYTVNDPKKMRWLFDQKVEALITDVPDIARSVLDGSLAVKPSVIGNVFHKFNPKSYL
ncbi:glycerophosphodiester phosphodiesterase [Pseudalkalibacillus sp. A8]|uniref:glycerophosphodiester phosphodiesterase n=1 Tax=Pseudalkalibacillus sp. A8 TaxID=3382641 RepID=UPI0038B59491